MSTSAQKTVAIFGATGGTGLASLNLALKAGHSVNVLARTPAKLADLSSQYPNLHIIKGDIRDIAAIKSTLTINNRVVDIVVSAIGMVIELKGLGFTARDPKICEDGTKSILSALSQLEAEKTVQIPVGGPEFVLLSTTGISAKGRDIPIAMMPLYHWMLSTPHKDKKKMEEAMIHGEGRTRRWVLIRPSFLWNGESKGIGRIRTSTETPGALPETENIKDVAVGYVIHREDVALWIVEECIRGDGSKWHGKMVTLTY
ncbi:hypothetical protein ONS95_014546 [Cadophora gregata]|uniref:uncharacterized protein n=1 Tax=Cadophora gregata TaxID=51156 RepID=UPI0026DDB78A|nr:uncharacterized protein ONS95_014546 [Cadophora gregata]KAK0112817.1 hypothetical protein ONS95_014546 [Cadophora gregata]KAK0124929.1 hypothetical protein ONS96_008804 [Cadophora gregata f. sp. sojae]